MKNDSLIDSLSNYKAGKLPLDVFNKVAELTVTPVIEVIASTGQGLFLIQRQIDDQFWPGKYSLPGVIVSSNKYKCYRDFIDSLVKKHKLEIVGDYNLIDIQLLSTARGQELALIYRINLDKNFKDIIPWNKLNELDIIPEHRVIIENYYKRYN